MHGLALTRIDEVTLAQRIQRGDRDARETMIESNLGLVHALAGGFRGSGVPLADLVQEGTIGLVRAVERFDPHRGVKFSTYATWWIRRSLLDAVAAARLIRIPPKANRQLAAVLRTEAELGARRASDGEIADRTDLGVATVSTLRTAAHVTASLDQPVGEDTMPLADVIADTRAVDPSESAIAHEQHDTLAAMLALLPTRHRDVLVRRYGLDGHRVEGHKDIGLSLGIGEERSRQIERESLHRLRSIAATSALAA
jgi:RNA polymerase sigma factor (sigma-70 family)